MQKLQLELKNIPKDVFQVPSSISLELNSSERDSAQDKVLDCNNLEGNQPQQTEGSSVGSLVFILNFNGNPLMPCKPQKAKKLLLSKKAKVIKRYPFTIQLLNPCANRVYDSTLGIDTGYGNIGFSVISDKRELISGTLILDRRTSKRLKERKMYRYDTHLNLIKKLKSLVPIGQVIIEIGKFDIQKLKNPEIKGTEYQQGNLYDYNNTKAFFLTREHNKCQFCSEEFKKGDPKHVHHIIPRTQGGTNSVDNLAILHKECHEKLHREKLFSKLKKNKQYKESTFMNIVHKKFWIDILSLKVTYGYITYTKRNELGLEKSHVNDAFVIAQGTSQLRTREYRIEQKHRHSRKLQLTHKGKESSIKKLRYKIQPKDLVMINNKWYKSQGILNLGRTIRVEFKNKNEYKTFTIKKYVEKYYNFGSFLWN